MLPHRDHLGYNKLNVAQRATLATPFPRSHPRLDRGSIQKGRRLATGVPKLGVGVTTQNVVRRCERPKRLSFCPQQCRDSKQVPCASTVWITSLVAPQEYLLPLVGALRSILDQVEDDWFGRTQAYAQGGVVGPSG